MQKYITFKKCTDGYENTTFDTAFFIESLRFVCFFLSFPFILKVKVARLCLTLCDPMDYTVHGILQARMLEWVAFPFSRVLT